MLHFITIKLFSPFCQYQNSPWKQYPLQVFFCFIAIFVIIQRAVDAPNFHVASFLFHTFPFLQYLAKCVFRSRFFHFKLSFPSLKSYTFSTFVCKAISTPAFAWLSFRVINHFFCQKIAIKLLCHIFFNILVLLCANYNNYDEVPLMHITNYKTCLKVKIQLRYRFYKSSVNVFNTLWMIFPSVRLTMRRKYYISNFQ